VSIKPKIKYEGFGGGPLLMGAWGPGPLGSPLNPALDQAHREIQGFVREIGLYRPIWVGKVMFGL